MSATLSDARSDGGRVVRVAGHFGEFLQGKVGGQVALVTLPCPVLAVTVRWRRSDQPLTIDQPEAILRRGQILGLLQAAGLPATGELRIAADMRPGMGAGASSAALIATARAFGIEEGQLAPACLAQEGATDPLMLADPAGVLWAPRSAQPLRQVPTCPGLDVVGGYLGPPIRTDPADTRFAEIDDLLNDWLAGRCTLPQAATLSALRNRALRGGPALDPVLSLQEKLGAQGVAIAHTGATIALLFEGAAPDGTEKALQGIGVTETIRYQLGALP